MCNNISCPHLHLTRSDMYDDTSNLKKRILELENK